MGLETLAIVGIGATLAATGLSVYSGIQQADTASAYASYNARVAEQNKLNAQKEATNAAQQQRRANSRILASMRARQGAAGNVDTGSAIESLSDTAAELELEALDIERQGKIAANVYEARQNIANIQSKSHKRAGIMTGAARGLEGGSRVLAISQDL